MPSYHPVVPFSYEEFDLSGVRTYPLASRQSKARVEDFARPYEKGAGLGAWLERLPAILAAGDLKAVVEPPAARAGRKAAASSGASARTSSRPASRRSSWT